MRKGKGTEQITITEETYIEGADVTLEPGDVIKIAEGSYEDLLGQLAIDAGSNWLEVKQMNKKLESFFEEYFALYYQAIKNMPIEDGDDRAVNKQAYYGGKVVGEIIDFAMRGVVSNTVYNEFSAGMEDVLS